MKQMWNKCPRPLNLMALKSETETSANKNCSPAALGVLSAPASGPSLPRSLSELNFSTPSSKELPSNPDRLSTVMHASGQVAHLLQSIKLASPGAFQQTSGGPEG